MKKFSLLLFLAMTITLLSACGSSSSEGASSSEMMEVVEDYDIRFGNALDEANQLLRNFSNSVDALYTTQQSNEQFAQAMRENIKKSSELVMALESHVAHANIFPFHQEVIGYFNNQHQLFLNAIEMANTDRINKDNLRSEYIRLKQEQAELINSWNNG